MMNRSQWIALASLIVLVVACFMPWVEISSAGITISGVDTTGTSFGKPAIGHFALAGMILLFTFIKRIWAKRFNIIFAALNLAWAIKNFMLLGRCEAGECPHKHTGIYLVVIASVAILVTTFLPNMRIAQPQPENDISTEG